MQSQNLIKKKKKGKALELLEKKQFKNCNLLVNENRLVFIFLLGVNFKLEYHNLDQSITISKIQLKNGRLLSYYGYKIFFFLLIPSLDTDTNPVIQFMYPKRACHIEMTDLHFGSQW